MILSLPHREQVGFDLWLILSMLQPLSFQLSLQQFLWFIPCNSTQIHIFVIERTGAGHIEWIKQTKSLNDE